MRNMTRARTMAIALLGALFALVTPDLAHAQNAVITGKVTAEGGQAVVAANVYINDLQISVPTNDQGDYTITIPAATMGDPSIRAGHEWTIRMSHSRGRP